MKICQLKSIAFRWKKPSSILQNMVPGNAITTYYTPNMYAYNLSFTGNQSNYAAALAIVMAIITLSSENGKPVADPEIITRGFVYVKEAEALMGELKRVVNESLASCERQKQHDWATIKGRVKSNISGYLYKTTRRSPMVLPGIIEV